MLELMGSLIEPFHNLAIDVHDDTTPSICPAHIRDRNEEGGRKAVQLSYLATPDSEFPGETHGTDIECIGLLHDPRLELRQHRIGIRIVYIPKKLPLCKIISGST